MTAEATAFILGNEVRWKILARLADVGVDTVGGMARRFGCTPNAMTKQLLEMKKRGVVGIGPGVCYHLAEHLRPAPGQREIDFGWAVLKLDPVSALNR